MFFMALVKMVGALALPAVWCHGEGCMPSKFRREVRVIVSASRFASCMQLFRLGGEGT